MVERRSPPGPDEVSPWTPAVVDVELVRPLRADVLRPGWPVEASLYPGDDHPLSVHVGVCPEGATVRSVGSLLPEEAPWWVAAWPGVASPGGEGRWWRIRGMATDPDWRGRGLGRSVLQLLLERAEGAGGGSVWCNARVPAVDFYRRAGFSEIGEVFEAPGIGPHLVMWCRLPAEPAEPAERAESAEPAESSEPTEPAEPAERN